MKRSDTRRSDVRRFQRTQDVEAVVARLRGKMQQWGVTVSFLASQIGVSRQYAWQTVHYRTTLSIDRAREIERAVDVIIAQRSHMRSFGERLRAARISAGLTLKEAAAMIGYSWVGVERWERNVCLPKPGVLWHLLNVYGGSHPDLLAFQDTNSDRILKS